MSNALATQVNGIRTRMEESRQTIFAAAAKHIRPERFIEQIARACYNNPDLVSCERPSLFLAAAEAATLGLEIDGVLGHAYLVPFKNGARSRQENRDVTEVTLIVGYLGLKELLYRSGMVSSLETGVVHDGDQFDYRLGTDKFLHHAPKGNGSTTVTHVYAIVTTTTGGTILSVMSWAEIEVHRNKFAKGAKRSDSAWQTNPVAMAVKTVVRKVAKLAPISAELQQLLQREEYIEPTTLPAETLNADQIEHIRRMLAIAKREESGLLEWLQVADLAEVPAGRYEEICAAIHAKPAITAEEPVA